MTRSLIRAIFGSKLYGTSVPSSDTDYKYVFTPSAQEILMQRVPKTIQRNTGNDSCKNLNTDIDDEGFSLSSYFHLLSQGQTLAVELLFIPDESIVAYDPSFLSFLRNNRSRLISKKAQAFVGYCRSQSKNASTNQNIDWKAVYHALRVAYEAKELLETGHLTFPRPEASLLLKIRNGELAYLDVSDLIDSAVLDVELWVNKSPLRGSMDTKLVNDFIEQTYLDILRSHYGARL